MLSCFLASAYLHEGGLRQDVGEAACWVIVCSRSCAVWAGSSAAARLLLQARQQAQAARVHLPRQQLLLWLLRL